MHVHQVSRRWKHHQAGALFALALPLLLLWAPLAQASLVAELSLAELCAHADVVATGRVESVRSAWQPDGHVIMTEVILVVDEGLWGADPGASLSFWVLGGQVGEIAQVFSGEAAFTPGEEVMVFLEKRGERLGVIGLSQGKYRIEEVAGQPVAQAATHGLVLVEVAQPLSAPTPPEKRQVLRSRAAPAAAQRPLADLLDEVRGHLLQRVTP